MPKLIDLTGYRFGLMTVVERTGCIGKHAAWLCQCDCGNMKVIRSDHLIYGKTVSCGCFEDETRKAGNHYVHGGKHSRLYNIWCGMRKRCNNPNCSAYNRYGGRGITICDEWQKFEVFRDWALSNGYADSLSIDRINVDGNYEPNNCRWSDAKEQANNRRPRKRKSK